MTFRSIHDTFTEHDFHRHGSLFWFIPRTLTDGPQPLLRKLKERGGSGAIRLLPVLGILAGLSHRRSWLRSIEELARLTGCDQKSCDKGRDALRELDLVQTELVFHPDTGLPTTAWTVSPQLSAQRDSDDYFFFPARWLYGGNVAQLSHVQLALLIAVATRAQKFEEPVDECWYLREYLRPGAPTGDIADCRTHSLFIRLASASRRWLVDVTGYSERALDAAIVGLKPSAVWGGEAVQPERVEFSPLWVYPPRSGQLLFHFRDHVRHWPWEVLNGALTHGAA